MKDNMNIEIVNMDNEGNVISEAFPVSKRMQKDHRKTSVGYTLVAVLLHILAFVPIIAISTVLAVRCYNLMPYYSFWPFVGVIITGVFGLIFLAVSLIVTRKKSKSSIMGQTAKVAITFVCLTCVFALLLTYILPDVISNATQGTLYAEDVYYNGESQAETNAKLERDFIMYNLLNGNLNKHGDENGDFSYKTLSKREENSMGSFVYYYNEEIQTSFDAYTSYGDVNKLERDVINVMKRRQPKKYELYEFIYKAYVLNDYDYALVNTIERRAIALSIVDYEYKHSNYEGLLKEGFSNAKIKQLFDTNFDNFNHDGYQAFDDPMLLFAQMSGRMTIPVVLRLILNDGWKYSQGAFDEEGNVYFTEEGNLLYELYDPDARDEFVDNGGEFIYEGTRINGDGKVIKDNYNFNKDGWIVYESGVVKRPITWLVLDMLGDPMDIANVDINTALAGLLGGIPQLGGEVSPEFVGTFLSGLLSGLGGLVDSVGGLVQGDVGGLIQDVTGGANLTLSLCIDDNGNLNISITPMNATYGMLGYMQASWVQSDNLLLAVINVLGIRNWLCIFGAIGVVLVIGAGILRECGKKTRMRTAVARDRMLRANTAEKIANGELDPESVNKTEDIDLGSELTPADVVAIEKAQKKKNKKNKHAKEQIEEESLQETAQELVEDNQFAPESAQAEVSEPVQKSAETVPVAQAEPEIQAKPAQEEPVEETPVVEKKGLFGRKKKDKVEEVAEESTVDFASENEFAEFEEPAVEKKGLFGRKKKEKDEEPVEESTVDLSPLDETTEEEPVIEKKGLFGRKKKDKAEEIVEESAEDTLSLDETVEEEPVVEKKGLFGRKKKDKAEEVAEEPTSDWSSLDDTAEEEPVVEKKSRFGRKKKKDEQVEEASEGFDDNTQSDGFSDLFD